MDHPRGHSLIGFGLQRYTNFNHLHSFRKHPLPSMINEPTPVPGEVSLRSPRPIKRTRGYDLYLSRGYLYAICNGHLSCVPNDDSLCVSNYCEKWVNIGWWKVESEMTTMKGRIWVNMAISFCDSKYGKFNVKFFTFHETWNQNSKPLKWRQGLSPELCQHVKSPRLRHEALQSQVPSCKHTSGHAVGLNYTQSKLTWQIPGKGDSYN